MKIEGYEIVQKIYEADNSEVFIALRELYKKHVIIKYLNKVSPGSREIARFKREFDILSTLPKGISVEPYVFIPYKNSFAIIMEYFGDCSLKNYLESNKLSLHEKISYWSGNTFPNKFLINFYMHLIFFWRKIIIS